MIPNLIHFPANPTLKGQAELIQDVPYSKNGLAHYWSAETENSKNCEMLC